MRMENIDIWADAGDIWIQQESTVGERPDTIIITPEQAKLVCEWIMRLAQDAQDASEAA